MTELSLRVKEGCVCFEPAGSQRDTVANVAILMPSRRVLRPLKHYESCEPLGDDTVVVKYYVSNRGVPYLEIYRRKDLEVLELVASFWRTISTFAVKAVLEKLGLSEDDVEFVLGVLGL